MTTTDETNGESRETAGADDESLPAAVKVMIVLILLAILGVVVVDILHFAGV
jgi:hypothetical protein